MRRAELTASYDLVIAGSGFAGSLMAMIAVRLGYSVALIERGRHPRVVIGESSTPLANLLLEELCRRYDLPPIAPLAKWGSWQRAYPQIGCGLKRGFTFYHHERNGETASPAASFETQLLVAASPHNEIADTHWYRADVDAFLVDQAQAVGAVYFGETIVEGVEFDSSGVRLLCRQNKAPFELRAQFLIDATGPRGLLHSLLKLHEEALPKLPQTQALWSHFEGVARPPATPLGDPPYPPEDAAVHHVFDGGWIWVLRFNNGITSAGVAATDPTASELGFNQESAAWARLLSSMPSLEAQFRDAKLVRPFQHIPRLSFLSERVAGERWAMLPSAAGFVDPLLSTGFPLTLLGIERMAKLLESGLTRSGLASDLAIYERKIKAELHATARLVGALYANMSNFERFRELSLLYFAAASYSETARRLGKPRLAQSFLLHDHPTFGPKVGAILEKAHRPDGGGDDAQLVAEIREAILPIDVAGLSKLNPRHSYPVSAADLLDACTKVDATRLEIEALLQRSGFYLPEATRN